MNPDKIPEPDIFGYLGKVCHRPAPFQYLTTADLWTDEHISGKMLEYHLNERLDIASRNIDFINRSVEWILSKFKLNRDSYICDFGCGPGLYTSRFAAKGINVTGIDFSRRSIEYAREDASRKNLPIEYVLGDYLQFKNMRKYDLITLIFCDFCALSPKQRKQLLGIFQNSLSANGKVILDLCSYGFLDSKEERYGIEHYPNGGFWASNPHFVVSITHKYLPEKLILDKYTIIEKSRTRDIYNWLQCYEPDTISKEFSDAGFNILEVLGDISGTAYNDDNNEFAIIAEKLS